MGRNGGIQGREKTRFSREMPRCACQSEPDKSHSGRLSASLVQLFLLITAEPDFIRALDGGRISEAVMRATAFPKNTGQLCFALSRTVST